MQKEISVIIPCYNSEKYLVKCIESLVHQTIGLEKMEYIFVNDASTDRTWEILNEYEKQYSESIVLINLPENCRQGTAKNIGMSYATGKYIGFCDSDDYIEPEMYELLYKKIIETGVDYVICQRVDECKGKENVVYGPQDEIVINLSGEEFKNSIIKFISEACMPQCLFNKEFMDKVNIKFPERLTYEDNFFMSILNYYVESIATITIPLYHYVYHNSSTIHKRNATHHLDRLKIEVLKLEEIKKRNLLDIYKEDIEAEFLKLYFINTIYILISRFDEIPEGIVREMQSIVKKNFPNWKNNFLLNNFFNIGEQSICKLLDYTFEKGNKEEVLEGLRKVSLGE